MYPELSATVTDSRRFIVENFELINEFCLETYHSALVWPPIQSIIRKHYATQKPDLPKVTLGLQNTWGSCERTIICGSEVYSVAFSSDGSRIVSGSDNGTIQIWSAATGKLESILEGHSASVWSVGFSKRKNTNGFETINHGRVLQYRQSGN
jgi:WD40 repeat protein